MERAIVEKSSGKVLSVVNVEALDYDPGPGLISVPVDDTPVYAGCIWRKGQGFSEPEKPSLSAEELQLLKISLKSQIDQAAETERMKYITPGVGQAMTYQMKAGEATRFLASSNPQPEEFPLLAAEIGVTADTLSGVAATVSASFNLWLLIGGQIEATRLRAKATVEAATNEDEARSAAGKIDWPVF